MGLFKRAPKPEIPVPGPEEARPLPDSGLAFTGWYRTASETVATAGRDNDPRCVVILCVEASAAIAMAKDFAVNTRQKVLCNALSEANESIREIAKTMPVPERPHSHDPADLVGH